MLTLLLALVPCADAQDLLVQPYLQDATPTSVWVQWETDSGEEAVVEWGLSPALGEETAGISWPGVGESRMHAVELTGLPTDSDVHYRVRTGEALSPVYALHTDPADPEASLRFLAMSDMQRDWLHPDKFREVVEDGVIDFLVDDVGLDVGTALAFTLIPGDLVDNGNNISEWRNTFFEPGSELLAAVPTYPVPGNHENDADHFFRYFKLPENGAVLEHSWWFDRGNVRIVGLDSNSGYRTDAQLEWLEGVLDDAAGNPEIDFVFAQLHHPHRSELWLSGELSYTGDVIALLESFSTASGKPSAHFFGHTHGYSRGQSRDHSHVMVNVASAGGNVDYWGQYAQADYDAFAVTTDDYGFVLVDVTAGDDPSFQIRRVSRGNIGSPRDNEVRDTLTVRRFPVPPDAPVVTADGPPECLWLSGGPYSGRAHGATQWQVGLDCSFSETLVDQWLQHTNVYGGVDRQAGDDLTDVLITELPAETELCARARYRDQDLAWSEWSEPLAFVTGETVLSPNLIVNGGAEDGTADWVVTEGVLESLTSLECDGIEPNTGERYFSVGGLCDSSVFGAAHQVVDVSDYADEIDAGGSAWLQAHLANWGGSDEPSVQLVFLDEGDAELGRGTRLSDRTTGWERFAVADPMPAGTRAVRVELTGTRNAGSDNDSYVDDLVLQLGPRPDLLCAASGPDDTPLDTGDTGLGAGSGTATGGGTATATATGGGAGSGSATGGGSGSSSGTTSVEVTDTGREATDKEPSGCGCQHSGPGGGLPLLVLLALGLRRRAD